MSSPNRVEVFTPADVAECLSAGCDLGCDHCRRGPATDSPRLDLGGLRELLMNSGVDSWWADYSTAAGRLEACDRLNNLLEDQGNDVTVTPDSLDGFLAQAAPVVAVGGRVLSIIVLPTAAQLDRALAGPPAER